MIIRTLIDNEAINLMLSFSSIFNHCALITSSNLNSKQLNGSLYFSQYLTHINGLLSSQCPHQIHESELYYLMNVILLVFLCLLFLCMFHAFKHNSHVLMYFKYSIRIYFSNLFKYLLE